MKSLEQDALRAQMVLSKSQEGRSKRGPLERLAEAPSPAPTPSPTPLEGLYVGREAGARPAARTSPDAPFLFLQTSAPRPAPPRDAW